MAVNVQDILTAEDYKERYGFYTNADYVDFEKGLSEAVVRKISALKEEPQWMLEKRLLGYKVFESKPTPKWGADLSKIDYNDIYYYKRLKGKEGKKWEDVPEEIKKTFDKLGVPEAERKFFAGAEAQFDSGVVYSHVNEELEKLGVIFTDTDTAVKKYPELLKKFFGTVIPPTDNKFAALNSAVWSGGSFIYVPKGVKVPMPLNAYFRINAEKSGQFERTLIVADEGADVTYIEGCTAPVFSSSALHAAVVELVAHKDAHIRYVTIQNWAKNVYNLVTQRADVQEGGHVEWIDANIGSKINMKYPSVYLKGRRAKGEILSIALAGEDQVQDSGGKVYHFAPDTTSRMVSKSISKGSGLTTFRGLVYIGKDAENAKVNTTCDALLLDDKAKTNTYPYVDIQRNDAMISHEAKVVLTFAFSA
ncbi:MAG: Fe-S cluster assembly protein SufB, partial [Candidatus Marsarchaeota archaeon]|nr:Fe-S cluster assembly protein SufB [Candidatus Marsarchaeota archaeon]